MVSPSRGLQHTAAVRMMYRCFKETLTIAVLLLSAVFPLICSQTVRGTEGQSVTLPCSYKVRRITDITAMCWGRGSCPNSKCNDVLIWTDGHLVTERSSDRYQLNDNIPAGKVSLTISQASMSDAGTYCCRIEHRGWFNDEKIAIQLTMEKAPTTTPPTTTRRTTPSRTRPPVRKTTVPPTTVTSVLPTTVKTTTPLPTLEITSIPSTTPTITTVIVPTEEDTLETTTVPIVQRTTYSEPTPAGSTTAPEEITTVLSSTTVFHITSPDTTQMDETTTQAQPTGTDSCVITDVSPEMNHPNEEIDTHIAKDNIPSQHASHPSQGGNSDLFAGNITVVEKKENGLSLHIIITAICVSVIVLVVVSLLIINFKGKERGRYLLGLDPNLELVSHAEAPLSETDVEISQTVTLEMDKVEADKRTY